MGKKSTIQRSSLCMYNVCCWYIHVHVWLCCGSVLSWCRCYFLLFQTRYHTLPYPKTMGNKSKPRMKLNYNMHMMCHLQLIFQALRIENWVQNDLFYAKESRLEAFNVWDVKVVWCRNGMYKSKRKHWKKKVFWKKTKHWLSQSILDRLGHKCVPQFRTSRFYTRGI